MNEPKIGLEEDDACNRDGCDGVMELGDVEDCLCHLSPPCQACMTTPFKCNKCGEEVPNETIGKIREQVDEGGNDES